MGFDQSVASLLFRVDFVRFEKSKPALLQLAQLKVLSQQNADAVSLTLQVRKAALAPGGRAAGASLGL
jgi:hypothetical protein